MKKAYIVEFWQAAAASFCFSCPLKESLNIDSNASKFRKKAYKGVYNSFNKSNPYGRQRDEDDK